MEICSRFTGMERKNGAFLLHTDNADVKVCFVTDEIVRVRASFDHELAEEPYVLMTTAWEDRIKLLPDAALYRSTRIHHTPDSYTKRELVGAGPLHLAYARPFCRLKAPLGLSLLRCASQTRTCRGKAPPSCCARPFCRLKAPLGLSLLRSTAQTRTFENTLISAACKKTQGKLWQKERGPDGAGPLDRIMRCSKISAAFIAVFKNSAEQNGIFTICSLRILLRRENRIRQKDKVSAGKIQTRQ